MCLWSVLVAKYVLVCLTCSVKWGIHSLEPKMTEEEEMNSMEILTTSSWHDQRQRRSNTRETKPGSEIMMWIEWKKRMTRKESSVKFELTLLKRKADSNSETEGVEHLPNESCNRKRRHEIRKRGWNTSCHMHTRNAQLNLLGPVRTGPRA